MQASEVLNDRGIMPCFARRAERTHHEELDPGVNVEQSGIDFEFPIKSYREAPQDLVVQHFHKRYRKCQAQTRER